MMTNLDYFYFFLRFKIDSGVKQVDLARSEHVQISRAYLNRLYLRPPKSCTLKLQEGIAKYFGLTYDEMIAEGKRIVAEQKDENRNFSDLEPDILPSLKRNQPERRSNHPLNLIDQLNSVAIGIRQNYKSTADLECERDGLLTLLNDLCTGICIIGSDLNITYQNPFHRKHFGNLTGKKYELFWKKNLNSQEIIEELTANDHKTKYITHNGKSYSIQLFLRHKGNQIDRIVEHVIEHPDTYQRSHNEYLTIANEIFKKMNQDIVLFGQKRELKFATNNFGLLKREPTVTGNQLTLDQYLLEISDKSDISIEKLKEILFAYEQHKEIELDITFNGNLFSFQTKSILESDPHAGFLIIIVKKSNAILEVNVNQK